MAEALKSAQAWRPGRAWAALLFLPALACQAADPTQPPAGFSENPGAASDTPAPNLTVGGVYLLGSKPYALVDGLVLRLGDPLAEGRVSRIDEQGVWLKTATGTRLLPLLPQVKKTPAATAAGMEKKR